MSDTKKHKKNPLAFLGKNALLVICAAAGIILLCASAFFGGGKTGVDTADTVEEYRIRLQNEARELCESVAGIGRATVLLTLAGTGEKIYARNIGGETKQYVTVNGSGGESGLLLDECLPAVGGIAVVCRGGENLKIQKTLIDLLSAAFDIPSSKICVAGGE